MKPMLILLAVTAAAVAWPEPYRAMRISAVSTDSETDNPMTATLQQDVFETGKT